MAVGTHASLTQAVALGNEYNALKATDQYYNATGLRPTAGSSIEILALAWLGRHQDAGEGALVLLMHARVQRKQAPGTPLEYPFWTIPGLTLALLLCVAREEADGDADGLQFAWAVSEGVPKGKGEARGEHAGINGGNRDDDGDGGRGERGGDGDGKVAAGKGKKTEKADGAIGPTGQRRLSPETVSKLKERAGAALLLHERFAATFAFGEPRVLITKALIDWGLGGSAAASANTLLKAVESGKRHGMVFDQMLAHLYVAMMYAKDGRKIDPKNGRDEGASDVVSQHLARCMELSRNSWSYPSFAAYNFLTAAGADWVVDRDKHGRGRRVSNNSGSELTEKKSGKRWSMRLSRPRPRRASNAIGLPEE